MSKVSNAAVCAAGEAPENASSSSEQQCIESPAEDVHDFMLSSVVWRSAQARNVRLSTLPMGSSGSSATSTMCLGSL